jgi:hypothetical protein
MPYSVAPYAREGLGLDSHGQAAHYWSPAQWQRGGGWGTSRRVRQAGSGVHADSLLQDGIPPWTLHGTASQAPGMARESSQAMRWRCILYGMRQQRGASPEISDNGAIGMFGGALGA